MPAFSTSIFYLCLLAIWGILFVSIRDILPFCGTKSRFIVAVCLSFLCVIGVAEILGDQLVSGKDAPAMNHRLLFILLPCAILAIVLFSGFILSLIFEFLRSMGKNIIG
jgi:hypothetical protein